MINRQLIDFQIHDFSFSLVNGLPISVDLHGWRRIIFACFSFKTKHLLLLRKTVVNILAHFRTDATDQTSHSTVHRIKLSWRRKFNVAYKSWFCEVY